MSFLNSRKILVTGGTGFKGSWLCAILSRHGANILDVSLGSFFEPSLFDVMSMSLSVDSIRSDINDLPSLKKIFSDFQPEIVFHLAAEALVGASYLNPKKTFETNVMGSLNILEAVRSCESVKSVIMVTTDKCYSPKEWVWGYREIDPLGGNDPYSASKAAAEIMTHSYTTSFFSSNERKVGISTVRAGNVIGGGDWSIGRIVPDIMMAIHKDKTLQLRNKMSIRPWQHVMSPLFGYIELAIKQFNDPDFYSGAWNFGPEPTSICSVGDLLEKIIDNMGVNIKINYIGSEDIKETSILKLDSSKADSLLECGCRISIDETIKLTCEWYNAFFSNVNMDIFTINQIKECMQSNLISMHSMS
jgi:CDP-glucose 4,6-dehydratase